MTAAPAEHARFDGHLRALSTVSDADELTLIRSVLTDPDPGMAQSSVLRHIDAKAERLDDIAYAQWRDHIAPAIESHELLLLRLTEWALLKSLLSDHPWQAADLTNASNWLQRKAAEHAPSPRALTTLAEHGRTKRVRGTAQTRLNWPPTRP